MFGFEAQGAVASKSPPDFDLEKIYIETFVNYTIWFEEFVTAIPTFTSLRGLVIFKTPVD